MIGRPRNGWVRDRVKLSWSIQISLRFSEMPATLTTGSKVYFHFLKDLTLSDRSRLKLFIAFLFKKEKKRLGEIHYIFCSDEYLLAINRQYLQHDFYTDIITFGLSEPGKPINAEIYISVDRVRENAEAFTNSLKNELHRVIFHGVLHLCGYGDKKKKEEVLMRKMEDRYLRLYFS
jgi:probable rRNA maturation factor